MTQKFTVVFDLDGTLVDTAPDLMLAHNHVMKKFGYPSKSLDELKSHHNVKVLSFNSEIMQKMFEISRSVIVEFSNLGEIHKEIYNSWYDSLKKYNNYQKFSDYGYIKERINSLKI